MSQFEGTTIPMAVPDRIIHWPTRAVPTYSPNRTDRAGTRSQINVQKISDFSFAGSDTRRVAVQLGSLRQCTRAFRPRESSMIESTLLLPVEQVRYTCFFRRSTECNWKLRVIFCGMFCQIPLFFGTWYSTDSYT